MSRTASKTLWLSLSLAFQTAAMILAKQAGLSTADDGMMALPTCPWFWLMLVAYAAQALAWLKALTLLPLSVAYPFTALTVGLNLLASRLLFAEPFSLTHVAGGALIIAGVWLVARGAEA